MKPFVYPKPVPQDTRPSVRECERKVIEAAKRWRLGFLRFERQLELALRELKDAERYDRRRRALFHVTKRGDWGLLGFEPITAKPKWTRGRGSRWTKADAERIAPLVGGRVEVAFS